MNVGTAAPHNTTLWQPLPDGPVITIPAGSTNVPVTSMSGFMIGQKIGLGYGASLPAVAAKYEQATVTAVGKPGTQGRLSAAASPVRPISRSRPRNITVGDTIRLDIGSVG